MSGYIRKPEEKILWFESGGVCYLCARELTFSEKVNTFGEQAHIYGEKAGSARYDKVISNDDSFVNTEKNLMLACPTCHTMIDKTHIDEYPVERLFEIKEKHESLIKKAIKNALLELNSSTFIELNDVYEQFELPSSISIPSINMPIPANKKIDKNGLSQDIYQEILIATTQVSKFRQFLNNYPKLGFSTKLRHGFIKKYLELFEQGLNGDSIYEELKIFASGNKMLFKRQIGAMVLIAYYFESCDIFES